MGAGPAACQPWRARQRCCHAGTAAHLDGAAHEGPALGADVALLAAGAHVVVVRQVDIEHQLALQRAELCGWKAGAEGRHAA
jgi:hypothetical protein